MVNHDVKFVDSFFCYGQAVFCRLGADDALVNIRFNDTRAYILLDDLPEFVKTDLTVTDLLRFSKVSNNKVGGGPDVVDLSDAAQLRLTLVNYVERYFGL